MSATELEAVPEPSPATTALPAILIAAVVQGWALYGLHQSILTRHWPATQLGWLLGLYAVVLLAPATLQLLVEHVRKPAFWVLLGVIGTSALYFGWHHGSAVADRSSERFASSGELFPLGFVLLVWWLLVLPFVQNRLVAGRWTTDYRLLFLHAWRNVIALAEAALFTALFWLILRLWESLFHLLGIDFFRDLFRKPLFVYPVTSIAFGCALHLIGSIDRLISAALEQILNVLKWLGTVAGFLLALFTIALVIELPGLVSSGSRAIGATWLLWLVAVVILFVNAAYRDGTVMRPYPRWIGQALRYCMPLLVIISSTAIYALGVRTTHYGLTVERVWGFIVAGAALLYSVGYSIAALRGDRWLGGIAQVNVVVALALVAAICGALSPLLSPYRLAADSQFERILAGRYQAVPPNRIGTTPFRYLGFDTGEYGRRRLRELAHIQGLPDADRIRTLAAQALAQRSPWQIPRVAAPAQLLARIPIYPAGHVLDPALAHALVEDWNKPQRGLFGLSESNLTAAGIFADLDGDGVDEFILLTPSGGPVYQVHSGHWQFAGRIYPQGFVGPWPNVVAEPARGNIAAQSPRWKDLALGSNRFRMGGLP